MQQYSNTNKGPGLGGKVHCKQSRGLIGFLSNKRAVWNGPGNLLSIVSIYASPINIQVHVNL